MVFASLIDASPCYRGTLQPIRGPGLLKPAGPPGCPRLPRARHTPARARWKARRWDDPCAGQSGPGVAGTALPTSQGADPLDAARHPRVDMCYTFTRVVSRPQKIA